jgi:hypothetical protein
MWTSSESVVSIAILLRFYWVIIGLLLGYYWVIIGLLGEQKDNLTTSTFFGWEPIWTLKIV